MEQTLEQRVQARVQEEVAKVNASAMELIREMLAENRKLTEAVIASHATATTTTGTGRARKPAVRTLDTVTGIIYHAHSAAGKAVAPSLGLKVHNFVWYEIIAKFPARFKDVTDVEYQAYLKAHEAPATPVTPAAATNAGFVDLKDAMKTPAELAKTNTPPTAVKAEVKATTAQAQKKS